MSSNGYASPLRLELQPSRLLQRYLICVHLLALLAALLPMRLPWLVNLVMLLIVIYSAWRVWPAMTRRGRSRNPVWIWRSHMHWHDGVQQMDWHLHTVRLLSPWLVIAELQAKSNASRQLLCVWKDQIPPGEYRDLYRRLKFWRAEADHPVPGI